MGQEILWERLSSDEKKLKLFYEQKKTLDTFLKTGAINIAQYNKSYADLKLKMGINETE